MVAVALGIASAAGAQTGPSGATVQSLRQQADAASGAYFAALDHYQALTAQIASIEGQLPRLRAQVAAEVQLTVERAVAAYEQGGAGQLNAVLDSTDLLDAAQRTQWLQALNQGDDHSLTALQQTSQRLHSEEKALQVDQASSAAALQILNAQGQTINVELTAAVTQQNQIAAAQAATQAQTAASPSGGTGGSGASAPVGGGSAPGPPDSSEAAFLSCVKERESGGNYSAVDPSNQYFGAYQFSQATWNATANHAGRTDLINVRPDHASPGDQDEMAEVLYQWQGRGPWAGDGC